MGIHLNNPFVLPYKKYVATLLQTGLNAPVANVFENDFGIVVWTRIDFGIYEASHSLFQIGKTAVFLTSGLHEDSLTLTFAGTTIGAIQIWSQKIDDSGTYIRNDDLIGETTSIEIRVYP